jgi:hypothetical protein
VQATLFTSRCALSDIVALRLTVYSRHGCHLCDEMISELHAAGAAQRFALDVVNVDTDVSLRMRYGKRVPVLVHGAHEICHYHLDGGKLNEYLSKIR